MTDYRIDHSGSGVIDDSILMTRGVRLMSLVGTVAVILSIVGGVKTGDASTESDISSGLTLRRVGAIMFLIMFVFVVVFQFAIFSMKEMMPAFRRKVRALHSQLCSPADLRFVPRSCSWRSRCPLPSS